MRGYPLNFGREQYNWHVPTVEAGATEDELKRADFLPKPRMTQKMDRAVDLMPTHPTS